MSNSFLKRLKLGFCGKLIDNLAQLGDEIREAGQ
jgi:hypothetical protein